MPDEPWRGGPRSQILITERFLRKHHCLDKEDRILEWKQGKIRKWRIDGSNRTVPGFYGTERIPLFRGMASCSYSSRRMFFIFGSNFLVADLSLISRLDNVARQSLRVIYSALDADSTQHLVSIRWKSVELEDDEVLADFVARVGELREQRLSELPAEWQQWAANQSMRLEAAGVLESEMAHLDEPTNIHESGTP